MGDKEKPLVAIITRAQNRLEYTIKCINAVKLNTLYLNYEHIIVSQDSTDGTVEWLNWIKKDMPNLAYFGHVKVLHPQKNLGSLGGTLYALDKTEAELIVVLDNDMEVPGGWLCKMVHLWEWLEANVKDSIALMARRIGVIKIKKGNFAYHLNYRKGIVTVFAVTGPAACFICRKQSLLNHEKEMKEHLHLSNFGKAFKVFDVEVTHMEGAHLRGDGSYLQNHKYKPREKKA